LNGEGWETEVGKGLERPEKRSRGGGDVGSNGVRQKKLSKEGTEKKKRQGKAGLEK